MRRIIFGFSLLSVAGLAACGAGADPGEGLSAQPGWDDPTARRWTRAGQWYPEDPDALDAAVYGLLDEAGGSARPARALLSPHAGLSYSGAVAAEAWARVEVPDTVIILSPHHWAEGADAAIWTEGPWLVPGYAIPIDQALTDAVMAKIPDLDSDRAAFDHHEVEMLLPFLSRVNPDVEMVVIGLRDNQDWHFPDFDLARIEEMGAALAEVIAEREAAGEAVLLILTTDLVHYVPREQADQEDPILLDHIARLDAAGLYESVAEQELSICGEVPIAVGMTALRALGATELELLAYDTSDSRTGDSSSVVGYASGRVLP